MRIQSPLSRQWHIILGVLPIILAIVVYGLVSRARHQENPKDKLTPGLKQFVEGWQRVMGRTSREMREYTVVEGDTLQTIAQQFGQSDDIVAEIQPTNGKDLVDWDDSIRALEVGEVLKVPVEVGVPFLQQYLILDTLQSLKRLALGIGVGAGVALLFGLLMGSFTEMRALFYTSISALARIPPLAILPIIFLMRGVGEDAKIIIIALGIFPTMAMDILLRVQALHKELIIKAYTLGASTTEVVFKVIFPQVMPGLIHSIRLALGPAWVFLIAAEAIASEAGLGYRIFLVQRQLGMNIILIYVVWIILIGLIMDVGLKAILHWKYRWAEGK